MRRSPRRLLDGRAFLATAMTALTLAAGCKKDPAAVESEGAARDRAALADPLTKDNAFDLVLRSVDHLSEAGEDEKAAALLESDGARAADAAAAAFESVRPASAWGRRVTTEMTDVVHARRSSIAGYVAALRGTDLDAKLAAVEEQMALEQRAMAAVAHAHGELDTWVPPPMAPLAPPPSLTAADSSAHP